MAHCALHLTNSAILFPRPIERWFWSDRTSIIREYIRWTATQKHSVELQGKNMAIFPLSLLPLFFLVKQIKQTLTWIEISHRWSVNWECLSGGNHCRTFCRNNQSPSELFLCLNGHIHCVKCSALCCNSLIQTYNCPIHYTNYNMLCLNSQ